MSAVAEPVRDENGVAILPGYRKPFAKGHDPRRFDLKARLALLPPQPKHKRRNNRLLGAIRKSFHWHCRASREAIDLNEAWKHAKLARIYFDMECVVSGIVAPNSTKNHRLQKLTAIAPIQPISPVSPKPVEIMPPSLPQDASCQGGLVDSTVKPVATPLKSIESTPIESQSDDDCPF